MTTCNEAYEALSALCAQRDASASTATVDELGRLGLVMAATAPAEAANAEQQLASMRERLLELERERQQHRAAVATSGSGSPDGRHARIRLDHVEEEERHLRSRFVDLVQATEERRRQARLSGAPVQVTYRGRELMEAIGQRRARAGDMEVKDFNAELDAIKAHFDARAAEARAILQVLSKRLRKVDEINLRTASVGLTARAGPPEESARLFERAYKVVAKEMLVPGPAAITLTEALAIGARDEAELERLIGDAVHILRDQWGGPETFEDQARAAAIILSSGMDQGQLVRRSKELMASVCQGEPSTAAYLASLEIGSAAWGAGGQGVVPAFAGLLSELKKAAPTGSALGVAASLLMTPGQPPEFMMKRFGEARAILERFDGDEMVVPSAIVAIMPSGVEETMDNVRLAAAAVARHRLSLGGFENLSLGVKLLTQSAMLASVSRAGGTARAPSGPVAGSVPAPTTLPVPAPTTAPAPTPASAQGPMAAFAPPPVLAFTDTPITMALAMGAGLLAFHELSYHKFAVVDFGFHPVHMHFVYG